MEEFCHSDFIKPVYNKIKDGNDELKPGSKRYKLIPEKLWDDWEHYIDARIEELYRGEEIEHALQIMEAHASGMSTEEIYEFIISQNYSGNVLITLKTIIAYFYPKGLELIEEISKLKNGRTK